MNSLRLFFCLFLFLPFSAHARELPPAGVLGPGFGVQVRSGDIRQSDLDGIKKAGFKFVRFDMSWGAVERKREDYSFRYFDDLIEGLRERGLGAVVILAGSNALYEPMVEPVEGKTYFGAPSARRAPSSPESVAAFARFAGAAAARYGAKGIIWEIGNEPDMRDFWPPAPDPEVYATLAGAACRAIRDAQSEATVIGPGTARIYGVTKEDPRNFLAPFLASSEAGCFDGVSLHTHRWHEPPETVIKDYVKARTYIAAHTPKGRPLPPILDSEGGYPTSLVSKNEQAAYALRRLIVNTLSRVPLTIWYEWRDSRLRYVGADDPENHFGLIEAGGEAKPGLAAVSAFLEELSGAVLQSRLHVGDENVYVVPIKRRDGRRGLLVWDAAVRRAARLEVRIMDGIKIERASLSPMPRLIDVSDGPVKCSIEENR